MAILDDKAIMLAILLVSHTSSIELTAHHCTSCSDQIPSYASKLPTRRAHSIKACQRYHTHQASFPFAITRYPPKASIFLTGFRGHIARSEDNAYICRLSEVEITITSARCFGAGICQLLLRTKYAQVPEQKNELAWSRPEAVCFTCCPVCRGFRTAFYKLTWIMDCRCLRRHGRKLARGLKSNHIPSRDIS